MPSWLPWALIPVAGTLVAWLILRKLRGIGRYGKGS